MEGHLVCVQRAKLARARTDANPHVAAAVVPRAREDALALGHARGCGGGCWRDEDAGASTGAGARVRVRVIVVDRTCRMDPGRVRVRVRVHGVLVEEGYGFGGGEGPYALR